MKLPNAKNAYIPEGKLLDYLLSETHPVGRFKAKFFRQLGFNENKLDKFEKALLSIAHKNDVEDIRETDFGINYVISGKISMDNQKATIKTVWFIETGQTKPRFVTAIPGIIYKEKRK